MTRRLMILVRLVPILGRIPVVSGLDNDKGRRTPPVLMGVSNPRTDYRRNLREHLVQSRTRCTSY